MNKFGIIIAIEDYSDKVFPQLSKIDFAINDASSMKKIFTEQLYIEESNIIFLANEDASKANIQNNLDLLFQKFTPNDECYFYYIGHGFNTKTKNRITCWDTDNLILDESTLSIEDILIAPLRKSECKKSFIFIDSSAEEIKSKNKLKEAASNLIETEYSELVRKFPGNSFFLSCYPGEKTFSSAQVKHGIWTYHLLNALNGKDESAIDKNGFITNISLSHFLSMKIPQYITKTMFINDRQSPFSVTSLTETIPLLKFEDENHDLKKTVEIQFQKYVLSKEQHIPYKNFSAFIKNKHKIPKDHNSFSSKLASELAQEEYFKPEIEKLFDNARKTLRLKNSNTVKDPEGGALHTEFFRYNMSSFQSETDCTQVTIMGELELRVPLASFPMPIDDLFTDGFDTITFPIKGALDIDSIEDALYDLEDENNGTFEHKNETFSFYPQNIKGIAKVNISKNTLKIIFTSSQTPITEILDYSQQTLIIMAAALKNLLSS